MRAVLYEQFGGALRIEDVEQPSADAEGVVIRVMASGICRSDWHGWKGHDPDIRVFPHVPGHELAGVVESTGAEVARFQPGDRVTVPFVAGCGRCPECASGNPQVCDAQSQPGFTHWGSFAEFVAIDYADANLVKLPDEIDFVTAAALGCRFATAYRAIVAQARVEAESWVAIHGCGGVGLSALLIARALSARVVAVDIGAEALRLAASLGAEVTVDASQVEDVAAAVVEATGRGADVSLDCLGSAATCVHSILSLRKRGRHVQVGLLAGDDHRPSLPMEHVIARELEIVGSHGMQSARYGPMLEMIVSGRLDLTPLLGQTLSLEEAPAVLMAMDGFESRGIRVINRFQ